MAENLISRVHHSLLNSGFDYTPRTIWHLEKGSTPLRGPGRRNACRSGIPLRSEIEFPVRGNVQKMAWLRLHSIGVSIIARSNRPSLFDVLKGTNYPTSKESAFFPPHAAGCGFNPEASGNAPVDVFLLPSSWSEPSIAASESEWLRINLHQWLDEEFCPEPANEGISSLCAQAYERCLLEKQLDLGDILLQMVDELSNFSFKESFHGAFSSANAAAELIAKRVLMLEADAE